MQTVQSSETSDSKATKRVKSKRAILPPDALRQLINHHGSATAVAEQMGVSPEVLQRGVREGKISQPMELAARYLLSRAHKEASSNRHLLVICRPEDLTSLKALCKGLQARLVDLDREG